MESVNSAPITVAQMDALTLEIRDLKDEKALVEYKAKELAGKIQNLEVKALAALDELQKDNYRGPGGILTQGKKFQVTMPKDDASKMELFEFLKREGIFEKYATVSSQALNSLYNEARAEAEANGELTFSMPGVGEAKLYRYASLKN